MFPPLLHLVVVVFIIVLPNIALLKVNTRNSDINNFLIRDNQFLIFVKSFCLVTAVEPCRVKANLHATANKSGSESVDVKASTAYVCFIV